MTTIRVSKKFGLIFCGGGLMGTCNHHKFFLKKVGFSFCVGGLSLVISVRILITVLVV